MIYQREHIKTSAKMYECQESAKKLFGDEYSKKIQWYVHTLKAVMNKENLDELKSVLFVSKLDLVKDSGFAIMMFMAAAVEIIEPNK